MKKLTSHSELLNKYIGEKGSSDREHFEAELRADILASKIKAMRIKRNMTQSELANLLIYHSHSIVQFKIDGMLRYYKS